MQYYRLFINDSDGLVCNDADLHGFDSDRLFQGKLIEDWDQRITLWYEKGEVEDYVANNVHWEVVSTKMRDAIERAAPGQAQYLPIQVRHRRAGKALEGYFAMNPLHRIKAFDWDRATYDVTTTEYMTSLVVMKYAVVQQAVAPYDLLRLAEDEITVIISERVRVALGAAKVTGCTYFKVPATG